jgi:hypothetical protein
VIVGRNKPHTAPKFPKSSVTPSRALETPSAQAPPKDKPVFPETDQRSQRAAGTA